MKSLVFGFATLSFASAALAFQTPTPAAPTLKAGGDDEKMQAFVAANCTGCHEISTLSAASHQPAEWDEILQRMVGYHPPLADADLKALRAYLVRTYPVSAK